MYKNIICPIDGSELGDLALEQAVYISKISNAKLIMVYVLDKWYKAGDVATHSPEWEAIHREWLDEGKKILNERKARLEKEGCNNIEMVEREGEISYEIIGLASERNADIIVMASHRYSPVGKLFHGSIVDRVTKRSPCPVLWVFN